jgi:hypothetical protein
MGATAVRFGLPLIEKEEDADFVGVRIRTPRKPIVSHLHACHLGTDGGDP